MDSEEIIEAAALVWHMHAGASCQVCKAVQTPTWRKARGYTRLCNRCGLRVQKVRGKPPQRKKKHIRG